jgi:biotin transport system substrate-specific component
VQQFKHKVCAEEELSWLDDVGSDPDRLRVWTKDSKACRGRTLLRDDELLSKLGPGDHYLLIDRGYWFRESYAGFLLSTKPAAVRISFYLAMIFVGYLLLFAGAQAEFYLWTDQTVPFTFQTLAVLLVPTLLGGPGFVSVFCYVLSGVLGAPVFAGMKGGIEEHLFAGYFVGFVISALLLSVLVHTGFARTIISIALCMILGIIIILAAGWIGYAYYSQWNWGYSFEQAVGPFIVAELIKLILAIVILILAWRLLVLFANRNRFGFNWRSLFTGLY